AAQVLRAPRNAAAFEQRPHLREIRARHADRACHRVVPGDLPQERADERFVGRQTAVELPVADDRFGAHGVPRNSSILAHFEGCCYPRARAKAYAVTFAPSRTAAAIESASFWTWPRSSPSTITRTTGSVPDGRSSTRPRPASSA